MFFCAHKDECGNFSLTGIPEYLLGILPLILNNAVRLICRSSRSEHTTPIIRCLRRLAVFDHIAYKLSPLTYSVVFGTFPHYLTELATPHLLRLYSDAFSSLTYQDQRVGTEVFLSTCNKL